MPHQFFTADLQANNIYLELKNYFYKKVLDCDMGRVFNEKNWAMSRYVFEY